MHVNYVYDYVNIKAMTSHANIYEFKKKCIVNTTWIQKLKRGLAFQPVSFAKAIKNVIYFQFAILNLTTSSLTLLKTTLIIRVSKIFYLCSSNSNVWIRSFTAYSLA